MSVGLGLPFPFSESEGAVSQVVPWPVVWQHSACTASRSKCRGYSSHVPGSSPGYAGTSELPAADSCYGSPTADMEVDTHTDI